MRSLQSSSKQFYGPRCHWSSEIRVVQHSFQICAYWRLNAFARSGACCSQSRKLQIYLVHLLQDISVKLQLAVAQEFSNHLSAESLPLQQKVCHSYGRVWDEPTCDQEVDASLWVPSIAKHREAAVLELAL